MNKNEMGEIQTKYLSENLKGELQVGLHWKIIFRRILRKWNVKVWAGFNLG